MQRVRTGFIGSFVIALTFGSTAFASEKIFFSSNRADPALSHIWMMNPDGTGLEQVTVGSVYDNSPQLSPDGTKLLFTRFYSINPDCANIWVRDLATGGESPVTSVADAYLATWSPDGNWIAFERTSCPGTAEEADIWLVGYPTGPLVALPGGPGRSDPTWAPDGTNIVYVRTGGGQAELRKFTLPAGPDVDLIPGTADERAPSYSPDGTRLAWFTDGGGVHIAVTADLGGSTTTFPGFFPAWSPDGTMLVINLSGSNTIATVDADGTNQNVLTSGPGVEIEPWWGLVNVDVGESCPCSGPTSERAWKNHGEYVSCVAKATRGRLNAGSIVSTAARSSCGK